MNCARAIGIGLVALVAIAGRPATAAEVKLLAGAASADITPEPGQRLWGYGERKQPATGTLDPLTAKAVVLRAGRDAVAIVALDLGRTPEEAVLARVRARTAIECGVKNLFVTASHTHSAPGMESTAGRPNRYAEQVGQQIADVICRAAKRMVPVRIGVGRGTADFAHNRRRRLPDGRVAMQWRNAQREPTGPIDKEFAVIRLDRQDGSPLAVLFHYACHPVVLGPDNLEYSADFVGAARGLVEKELDTTCLFLQGGCGDINPYMDKTPLAEGGAEEMRKMGRGLGELLVDVARKTKTSLPAAPSIQFEARQVPIRTRWDIEDPEVLETLGQAYGARFVDYIAPRIKNNIVPCTLTVVVIDGDVALVGMPGEIFVAFQQAIKNASPVPNSFLVGYTNGYHAYFPTLSDAAAGGYGGKTATYVEPGAGERLTNEGLIMVYKMTDQLHDKPRAEDFQLLNYDAVRDKSAN